MRFPNTIRKLPTGRLIFVILVSFFILFPQQTAASCTPLTDQEKYDQADAVIIGEVYRYDGFGSMPENVLGVFVTDILKNDTGSSLGNVNIKTPEVGQNTADDIDFEPRKSYYLYLYKTDDIYIYQTNACDGTYLINEVSEDKTVSTNTNTTDPSNSGSIQDKVIVIIFILGFIVGVFFMIKSFMKQKKQKPNHFRFNKNGNFNLPGLITFSLFPVIALINIFLTGTDSAWLLPKINPFLFGFMFFSVISGMTFRVKGIAKKIAIYVMLAFFSLAINKFANPFWTQYANWYILIGLVLGLIESLIENRIRKKKESSRV